MTINILDKEALSFDDLILMPLYSDIKSRKEIDTSVVFKKSDGTELTFQTPIISSPMSTITEAYMCNAINNCGGLGIIHRYNTIDHQAKLLSYVNSDIYKAAAIGASGDYKERLDRLVEAGLKIVCIDVAHGDHVLVKEAVDHIKQYHPHLFIIAGNIAGGGAYQRLSEWGVDAVRTSVGSGSICTTRIQTGHGMPTLSALIDCVERREELKKLGKHTAYIIADGGIKNTGDIVKCLAIGADMVMLGSMLSGTRETPGKVIIDKETGKKVKRYNGMASKAAQKAWKGSYSSIEGVTSYVQYKGTVSKVITEITSNIRSGMSYSSSRTLSALRSNALFVRQSVNSHAEGLPHIRNRK